MHIEFSNEELLTLQTVLRAAMKKYRGQLAAANAKNSAYRNPGEAAAVAGIKISGAKACLDKVVEELEQRGVEITKIETIEQDGISYTGNN